MIIGLIGYKQVGKSTAARYLIEQYKFRHHNFKDALVAEMKRNFPDLLDIILEVEDSLGDEYKSIDDLFLYKPALMRALLQNYGTDVRRKDDTNYWVKQWVNYKFDKNVVTDDVRFKNEAQAVKANEGILIRLTRPDVTTGGDHVSETEQLDIVADYTVDCEPGDHETLYNKLDEIYQTENRKVS